MEGALRRERTTDAKKEAVIKGLQLALQGDNQASDLSALLVSHITLPGNLLHHTPHGRACMSIGLATMQRVAPRHKSQQLMHVTAQLQRVAGSVSTALRIVLRSVR